MSESPKVAIGIAGTNAADARRLVDLGWKPTSDGYWTNGLSDPLTSKEALAVAETIAKQEPRSPPVFWTHFASSMNGTLAVAIMAAVVVYIAANPPTFVPQQTQDVIKYGVGIAGVVLGVVQMAKSNIAAAAKKTE